MNKHLIHWLTALLLISASANVISATTSSDNISDEPLGTGTGATVKPNVYFVFDDSGSMGWEYLPDHVDDKYCLDGAVLGNLSANTSSPPTIQTSTGGIRQCLAGYPPFTASQFNFIYYNPTITYYPGTKADGTTYPSMDGSDASHGGANWASVPVDAYGAVDTLFASTSGSATDTLNLITGYRDVQWCTTSSSQTDCRPNTSTYQYPDLVKYKYPKNVSGAPYYYSMSPTLYCTDYSMTSCQATEDVTHTVPSYYRWCTSFTAATNTYANCQGLRDATHVVPTYLGKILTGAGATATGGSITILASADYSDEAISSVTINNISLITSAILGSASSTSASIATALCTAIESNKATSGYGCSGVASAKLTLTAQSIGAWLNGTPVVLGPSGAINNNSTGSITITDAAANKKISTVTIGSTSYTLSSVVTGTGATTTAGQDLCNSLKATASFAALYNVRSGSTTWGTCNANAKVEIQRKTNDAVDEGKAISISGPAASASTAATGTITFSGNFGSNSKRLRKLQCGGTDVINQDVVTTGTSASTANGRRQNLANSIIANDKNSYVFSCGGACASGVTSMTVTGPTPGVSCTATSGGTTTGSNPRYDSSADFTVSFSMTAGTSGSAGPMVATTLPLTGYTHIVDAIPTSVTAFSGGQDTTYRSEVGLFTRYDVVNDGRTFTKASTRTDCAGASCTYQEEMTNFANWFAYYRTRCDTMKTGVFRAFAPIGDDYRVGFNTIYDNAHLDIADFGTAQKATWYAALKNKTCGVAGTPLMKGLSAAGRYYAGVAHTTTDPIQYSCQKNFTILSTDGYWNNLYSGGNTPLDISGGTIGDIDSKNAHPTLAHKYSDAANSGDGTPGTLADTALYYYQTDLRTGAQAHTTNDSPANPPEDPLETQRMITFTMGLGMDGLLHYDTNYKIGGSSDFNAIVAGTKNWGVPGANKQENVDDLWHAAVSGRGQYFSAADPTQVVDSLTTALNAIGGTLGAAAAAATSNLEPVEGDNYLYAASYITTEWTGDLESKTISIAASTAGTVSSAVKWSARDKLDARMSAGDARTVYTYDATAGGATGKAKLLSGAAGWTGLTPTEQGYFNITGMSSYTAGGILPVTADCNTTTSGRKPTECSSLLDYLLGASTGTASAFRTRSHILGDIVHSQPVYVAKPFFTYTDTGYATFASTQASRASRVYLGANDGMLHAFDGNGETGGEEIWAYVPSFALPNWWELGDVDYPNSHRYYVDGQVTAGDVYISTGWRTVIVGGLGKGGRGYYAIDVTDPGTPKVLWEFTHDNMGYTLGNPIITKLPNGTWVAIVTSGYDNVPSPKGEAPSGDGHGYVYVLNVETGALIYSMDTGDGTTSDPSNLGKLNNWVSDTAHNNTTMYLYGGDMHGNMWRFTVGNTSGSVLKLMQAVGPDGVQMITAKPELGTVDGSDNKRMVFFGTGRFLSVTDKTDSTKQSIYGLYDGDDVTTTLADRDSGGMMEVTLVDTTNASGLAFRTTTGSGASEPSITGRGWYIDLPDVSAVGGAERVDVDVKLQLGTLIVASNVPTSTDCNVGGYSYLYMLNYLTGSYVVTNDASTTGLAGVKLANALAVGTNVVRIGDKVINITTTSDKQYPVNEVRIGAGGGSLRRTGWRELIQE